MRSFYGEDDPLAHQRHRHSLSSRILPLGNSAAPSSTPRVPVAKGIPWDLLVPTRSAAHRTASAPRHRDVSVSWQASPRVEGHSPAGRPHASLVSSSPSYSGLVAAVPMHADEVYRAPSPRQRPSLDGFAFRSLQSQSSFLAGETTLGHRNSTTAGSEGAALNPTAEASPAPMTPPFSREATGLAMTTAAALRYPSATVQYYTGADQPYCHVGVPTPETAKTAADTPVPQPQPTGPAATPTPAADDAEVEIEEVTVMQPEGKQQRQPRALTQRTTTPTSSRTPSAGAASAASVRDGGSSARGQPSRRSLSAGSRGRSRAACLCEGRPLYPHLKEQQRLHTRGLVRLPTPSGSAASAAPRTRSHSSSSSHNASALTLDHSESAPQQRTAQWLLRLLEDVIHQVALQQQQHRAPSRHSRNGAGGQVSSSHPPSVGMSVADVLTRHLVARYGPIRWRSALEEMATAMQMFHRISPLIAVFRNYFTTPASGADAADASAQAVSGSSTCDRALTAFYLFCTVKEKAARNSFTVKQRVALTSAEQQTPQATIVARRYLRLSNIAVELTELLEAITIDEVLVVPAMPTKAGPTGSAEKESQTYYYIRDQRTARLLDKEKALQECQHHTSVVRLRRRLRKHEVRDVLDLLLAWIEQGSELATNKIQGSNNGEAFDSHLSCADRENRLAFDRVGCVDADAAAQALVESLSQVCCLHESDALSRFARRADHNGAGGAEEDPPMAASSFVAAKSEDGVTAKSVPSPVRSAVMAVTEVRGGETGGSTTESRDAVGKEVEQQEQPASVTLVPSAEYLERVARFKAILRDNTKRKELPRPDDPHLSLQEQRQPTQVLAPSQAPSLSAPVAAQHHGQGEKPWSQRSVSQTVDDTPLSTSEPPQRRASTPSPTEAIREKRQHGAGGLAADSGEVSRDGNRHGFVGVGVKPLTFDSSSILEEDSKRTSERTEGPRRASYVLRDALAPTASSPQQLQLSRTLADLQADLQEKKRVRQQREGAALAQPPPAGSPPVPMGRLFHSSNGRSGTASAAVAAPSSLPLTGGVGMRTTTPQNAGQVRMTAEEAKALTDLDNVLQLLRQRRRQAGHP